MDLKKYLQTIQTVEAVGSFAIDSYPDDEEKTKGQITTESDSRGAKRILIDLDNTIHKYSKGWADGQIYDDAYSGAKESIDWLKNQGYEIVIFTTRLSKENCNEYGQNLQEQVINVENWLHDHDIYFDRLTAEKLGAYFYVDDRAITIRDGNWDDVLMEIKERQ